MKRYSPLPLISSLILLLASTLSFAEIYKWVDVAGNANFSDKPPAGIQTEELELKINTYTPAEITPLVERLGKNGKVVMYDASWCGICKSAKSYLRENSIPYVSYDIETNRIGKLHYKLLKGKSVPTFIVGKKRLNGFTDAKFESLYKEEVLSKANPSPDNDSDSASLEQSIKIPSN